MSLTNVTGISMAMAVWLARNEYNSGADIAPKGELISATTLLKSTRSFILGNRVPQEESTVDVLDLVPSKLGHAIHASVEDAWRNYHQAMKDLGYPQRVIDAIRINPETVEDGEIPVYLEQRYFKEIDGVIVSGQLDQLIDGQLNDTKTTSVYAYINGSKVEDYRLQMSIYRWLAPERVTSDIAMIQHMFTDWQRSMARQNPNYPQSRLVEFPVELMSLSETELWIKNKLAEIRANVNLPEPDIIRCTDKELWRSEPKYKYYADVEKAKAGGRSTKNFDNPQDAATHQAKAGKGVVITVPGQVKACGYCPAFPICTQKDDYDHEGY